MLTMCNVYVSQNMVSPALAQRILAELRALDTAVEAADMGAANSHNSALLGLYAEAQHELDDERPIEPSGPVRPEEAGPR
jgi:molecular chaperone DnaK